MNEYLDGNKLIGDDYDQEQINKWFEDEKEGYANLGSGSNKDYKYEYHNINKYNGFRFIKGDSKFENVLGIGAAYGYEFEPVANRIINLHILEPSDQLVSDKIFGLKPTYKKPSISGDIDYPSSYFDLITCFGTLHHIPNVTHVMRELHRILKPGGVILIREPINSMGDWNNKRNGLTKRERGIPVEIFDKIIRELNFNVISKKYCFCMTFFIQRLIGRFLKSSVHTYGFYVKLDSILSSVLSFRIKYHPVSMIERIAPSNVFYVLKK